jgi:hypothetical protein
VLDLTFLFMFYSQLPYFTSDVLPYLRFDFDRNIWKNNCCWWNQEVSV